VRSYMLYIVGPDRSHFAEMLNIMYSNSQLCVDVWNILLNQTGYSAFICGIYCRARQATVC